MRKVTSIILFSLFTIVFGFKNAGATDQYSFVSSWTVESPMALAVDKFGNVYVTSITPPLSAVIVQRYSPTGVLETKLQGNFLSTVLAVDSSNNIYLSTGTDVEQYSSDGTLLKSWSNFGIGGTHYMIPWSVAVDSQKNVYINDTFDFRIQKYSNSGSFITQWGSFGSGNGQFNMSQAMAIDSSDNIYVADMINNRIQKFNSKGNFLTTFGSSGSADSRLGSPYGVAVDSLNNVYVADTGNRRVQKFDSNGNLITRLGSPGCKGESAYVNGNVCEPTAIAVDTSGIVYVADPKNDQILKFTPAEPVNNCAASLSSNLELHVPILIFGNLSYWAEFSYVPNTLDFTLTNAGVISDNSLYISCVAATLSDDFRFHIPDLTFNSVSYSLDMVYRGGLTLTVTGVDPN